MNIYAGLVAGSRDAFAYAKSRGGVRLPKTIEEKLYAAGYADGLYWLHNSLFADFFGLWPLWLRDPVGLRAALQIEAAQIRREVDDIQSRGGDIAMVVLDQEWAPYTAAHYRARLPKVARFTPGPDALADIPPEFRDYVYGVAIQYVASRLLQECRRDEPDLDWLVYAPFRPPGEWAKTGRIYDEFDRTYGAGAQFIADAGERLWAHSYARPEDPDGAPEPGKLARGEVEPYVETAASWAIARCPGKPAVVAFWIFSTKLQDADYWAECARALQSVEEKFPDQQIDAVVCGGANEHLEDPTSESEWLVFGDYLVDAVQVLRSNAGA